MSSTGVAGTGAEHHRAEVGHDPGMAPCPLGLELPARRAEDQLPSAGEVDTTAGCQMDVQERQRRILAKARQEGRVEVGSLAEDLAVAPETVRRDLRLLVDRGVLQRVHGGAIAVESAGFETKLSERVSSHVSEKRRIAIAAVQRLHGAETVYVDEGVTLQFVAEELRGLGPLTVVTSSLLAAAALADQPAITVLLLGGRVRHTMATVDHWAIRMLSELVIDLAYVGANGVSRDYGLTTPDPAVAAVKGEAVRRARRSVFVGVHTKFGASSFCRFAELTDFEAFITGTELSAADAHRYAAMGPHVIRA